MNWEGISGSPNPQDLSGQAAKDPQQMQIELEFAQD